MFSRHVNVPLSLRGRDARSDLTTEATKTRIRGTQFLHQTGIPDGAQARAANRRVDQVRGARSIDITESIFITQMIPDTGISSFTEDEASDQHWRPTISIGRATNAIASSRPLRSRQPSRHRLRTRFT